MNEPWVEAKRIEVDGLEVISVVQGVPVEGGTMIQVDFLSAIRRRDEDVVHSQKTQ